MYTFPSYFSFLRFLSSAKLRLSCQLILAPHKFKKLYSINTARTLWIRYHTGTNEGITAQILNTNKVMGFTMGFLHMSLYCSNSSLTPLHLTTGSPNHLPFCIHTICILLPYLCHPLRVLPLFYLLVSTCIHPTCTYIILNLGTT